jgi:hypothetical protein
MISNAISLKKVLLEEEKKKLIKYNIGNRALITTKKNI